MPPPQSKPKGKQPTRPPPEQPPLQSSSRSENPRHLPLDKSMQANPEVTRPRPKQQEQSGGEVKQRQDPPAQAEAQSESKGKQPMRKPVIRTMCFIARIPVVRGTPIERVKVAIGPDTAYRHPQTFFFKNIPRLEPYWGYTNDKAFTATRIVRLENEKKAMPYFLMVCRGECPKVKSPRNKNGVFMGMDEPIFGDAFVFKLGDPELYGEAYARYADIEEDIGSLDWLPKAIRDAARKVDDAKASDANPGFPDMSNYADEETMLKDAERMVDWVMEVRAAKRKHVEAFPVDKASGRPDLERMTDAATKLTARVVDWRSEGLLPLDENSESSEYQAADEFIESALDFQRAVKVKITDVNVNVASSSSASTDITSLDGKTLKLLEMVRDCFVAVKRRFDAVEAIVKANLAKKTLEALSMKDPTEMVDQRALRYMVDSMVLSVGVWQQEAALIGAKDWNSTIIKEISAKGHAALRAMDRNESKADIVKTVIELNEAYQSIKTRIDGVNVARAKAAKAEAAKADPAPATNEDENVGAKFKLLHIEGDESGTTFHFFRRLD